MAERLLSINDRIAALEKAVAEIQNQLASGAALRADTEKYKKIPAADQKGADPSPDEKEIYYYWYQKENRYREISKMRNLVLFVMTDYFEINKPQNIETVYEAFPNATQGSIGVVCSCDDAIARYGEKEVERRFFNKDKLSITFDNKVYIVCKEWTKKNIDRFIKAAGEQGRQIRTKSI